MVIKVKISLRRVCSISFKSSLYQPLERGSNLPTNLKLHSQGSDSFFTIHSYNLLSFCFQCLSVDETAQHLIEGLKYGVNQKIYYKNGNED